MDLRESGIGIHARGVVHRGGAHAISAGAVAGVDDGQQADLLEAVLGHLHQLEVDHDLGLRLVEAADYLVDDGQLQGLGLHDDGVDALVREHAQLRIDGGENLAHVVGIGIRQVDGLDDLVLELLAVLGSGLEDHDGVLVDHLVEQVVLQHQDVQDALEGQAPQIDGDGLILEGSVGNDVHAGGAAEGAEDLPKAGAAAEVQIEALEGPRVQLHGVHAVGLDLQQLEILGGVGIGLLPSGNLLQPDQPILGDLVIGIQHQGLADLHGHGVAHAPLLGRAGQGEVAFGRALGGPLDADAGLGVRGFAPQYLAVGHHRLVVAALVEGLVGLVQAAPEGEQEDARDDQGVPDGGEGEGRHRGHPSNQN